MSRKRSLNVLNDKLQELYQFIKKIKTDSDVRCNVCNAEFNILHDGKTDIETYLKSKRHKDRLSAASSSNVVTHFFKGSNPNSSDLQTAACEGVWAFHTIYSGHSFRSADCAAKIIRNCFSMPKFTCARTKCESIATGVFAPFVYENLQKDISECHFATIHTNASNHRNIKMFPVLVRYFSRQKRVKIKIVELKSVGGETPDIIVRLLNAVIEEFKMQEKLACFCGDNAPSNFGNVQRSGTGNTFYKLNQLHPGLIGIECGAHIIHNTLKKACDTGVTLHC